MCPCRLQGRFRGIEPGDIATEPGEFLCQEPAPAADIEGGFAARVDSQALRDHLAEVTEPGLIQPSTQQGEGAVLTPPLIVPAIVEFVVDGHWTLVRRC